MIEYTQKDLGYPRTPTTAKFSVFMPDGTRWAVPVQAIVDARDEFYRHEKSDTVKYRRAGKLGNFDILDWAQNNMNWSEVEPYACRVEDGQVPDYQRGWVNGAKGFIGPV